MPQYKDSLSVGSSRFLSAITLALLGFVCSASLQICSAASITEIPNEQIFVHKYAELDTNIEGCESVDWSVVNNRLLIDKKGLNRYYNIFSVTPEGFRMKPLTFAKGGGAAAQQHSGNGSWRPDGEYFVFASQNPGSTSYNESMPGIGWHCNLFLANREGNRFWQLTNITTSMSTPSGCVFPHFSPDGKRLFWSGNRGAARPPTPWQMRALYMADFSIEEGKPVLKNVQEFMPGFRHDFYEGYGFSPSGDEILFAGNLVDKQPWYGMDLYTLGRGDTKPVRLTNTIGSWDRYATYSPDGRKIVWASSNGFDIRYLGAGGSRWQSYLRAELWIMDADGNNKKQLTFLNTHGPKNLAGGRCFLGDTAWSPDGKTIAAVLHRENRRRGIDSVIVMLTLGEGPPPPPEANSPSLRPPHPVPEITPRRKKSDAQQATPSVPKW